VLRTLTFLLVCTVYFNFTVDPGTFKNRRLLRKRPAHGRRTLAATSRTNPADIRRNLDKKIFREGMTRIKDIIFDGKSFCFTGSMAELKRSQAEREVRVRHGLSQKVVNPELDYLVIGSIPSVGWKHGDYGNKIEKARQIIASKKSKLRLISEHDFILGLENTPTSDSGEIDEKLLVICG